MSSAAIYVSGGKRRIGPFTCERDALYFYGFLRHTHGQHREVINVYTADDIAYVLSGDDPAAKGVRFVRPSTVIMRKVRDLLGAECAA